MSAKLPLNVPLPDGWGEDRREEAEKLWSQYKTACLESTWGREKFRKEISKARTDSAQVLDWLDLADGWSDLEFETARQMKLKMTSREADRRIAEADAAKRPPVLWKNGTWLNAQQFDPLRWVVPGLFPEGLAFLAGAPKAGKSWLALSVGLSLAAGWPVLGSIAANPPRPVAYFALEDSDRRMQSRCAELGWRKVPELFWYATSASPDQVLDHLEDFLEHYAGQRPVAILDTWGKIMSPARKGETTYERDYRLGSALHAITATLPGSSLLVLHHTRKETAADFIDTVSGTQGVAGSADTIAILTRKRGEDRGQLHVTGRDVDEGSYALASSPRWVLDGRNLAEAANAARAESARANLGDRSSQILDLVNANGEVMTAEVALALGMTTDRASDYLGRLAKSGRIRKLERGHWESLGAGSAGKDADQETLVPTAGSEGSAGNEGRNPRSPALPEGDTRARAREAMFGLLPDGGYDWAVLWAVADRSA